MTWEQAVATAIKAGQIYGHKQRVFKHRYMGHWTYQCAEGWRHGKRMCTR